MPERSAMLLDIKTIRRTSTLTRHSLYGHVGRKSKPVAVPISSEERHYYLLLLAILGIGILARLFHFHLTLGSDDQRYIIAARRLMGDREIVLPSVYYGRIVWRWILALWGWWPGLTLESSAALMFLLSCISILSIAQAARMTFGIRAGLLAAAVYATHPLTVLYDVYTLPDNLAVALLAVSIVCFLKYVRTSHLSLLCLAAFVIGLTLAVKEYFVLLAFSFGICLLLEQNDSVKLRNVAFFLFFFSLGLSTDFMFHAWESGDPLAHWSVTATYGDRLFALGDYAGYSGPKLIARMAVDRLSYIESLFFSFGGVAGFISLGGLLFVIMNERRRMECRMLMVGIVTFFVFLCATPAKLWPLTFVEMQERYLIVLMPFLAICAGGAISAGLESLRDRGKQASAGALLLVAFAYNLTIPNNIQDRYRILEFDGIRKVLKNAKGKQMSDLFLPAKYNEYVPDSYHSYGVRLRFLTTSEFAAVDEIIETLREETGRAVFIPRIPYRMLEKFYRMGDPPFSELYSSRNWELMKRLDSNGFEREFVFVPNTSFRSWLTLLEFDAKDHLVGWLYMPDFGQVPGRHKR